MHLVTSIACGLAFVAQGLAQGNDTLLGTAATFVALAATTITNTGFTLLTGNLGLYPGTAITGFPPGVVSGTEYITDALAQQAKADATTAYNTIAGLPSTMDRTGTNLGNRILTPGVYSYMFGGELSGALTLDAQGNPNAQFFFQFGSSLLVADSSTVAIINGGKSCNVYWQVGSSATIGTKATFVGNVLALTAITIDTGATINGGLFALNAAITFDDDTVTAQGACATSPPPFSPPTVSPSSSSTSTSSPSSTSTSTSSPSPAVSTLSSPTPPGGPTFTPPPPGPPPVELPPAPPTDSINAYRAEYATHYTTHYPNHYTIVHISAYTTHESTLNATDYTAV